LRQGIKIDNPIDFFMGVRNDFTRDFMLAPIRTDCLAQI
jgi:hypothetical protein